MEQLVRTYTDLGRTGPGATDASVIAVAERLEIPEIATIDRRHFSAVRPRGITAFTLLLEGSRPGQADSQATAFSSFSISL